MRAPFLPQPKPVKEIKDKHWKYRRHKELKCSECGVKFMRRTDRINKISNYCSYKCSGAALGRQRKGKKLESARKGEYRSCKWCHKEFYAKRAEINRGKDKYCSRKCFYERQKHLGIVPKNFIASPDNAGKNNGMYKHGKRTGGNIPKRKVRNQVIKRDGNWCLYCGKPGPGLHLHRVVYGSQGGKYEKDNCVQLCAEHHELVHSSKKKYMPILKAYLKNGILDWDL